MAKSPNPAGSETITVSVSVQSARLLDQLAGRGIYGRNRAEVAGRFIDQALKEFVVAPKFNLKAGGK